MGPLDLSSTYPAGRELLFRLLAGAMAVSLCSRGVSWRRGHQRPDGKMGAALTKGVVVVVVVCLKRRDRRAGDRASDLAIAANITTFV
jgi:hypothetical protein